MEHPPTLPPTNSAHALPSEWLTLDGFNRMMREDPAAVAFARKVYGYLERMHPGRACTFVRYVRPQLEWCVRTAAAFILEGGHWREYSLSDDLLTVSRERGAAEERQQRPRASRRCSKPYTVPHPGLHVGLNTVIPKNTE